MPHLDPIASRFRQPPPGAIRGLTPEKERSLRLQCIAHLGKIGVINALEAGPLMAGHIDHLLDRMFRHFGKLRFRLSDTEWLEIHPGGMARH